MTVWRSNLSQQVWLRWAMPWLLLLRLHKPVGIYLVLWPSLIALVDATRLATSALPSPWLVLGFVFGAVFSRSAGCIANDLWDKDFDAKVSRTRYRPLATGAITPFLAMVVMLVLFTASACIAWAISPLVFVVALGAVPLIVLYPLAKRVCGHPQLVLSLSFSAGIPMAFAAAGQLGSYHWLLFGGANMAWIYAYDTIYAMADKADDATLGIGSSALSWGRFDWLGVATAQALTLGLLVWWWRASGLGVLVGWAVLICALGFAWQQYVIRKRSIARCIRAFSSNHWLQFGLLGAVLLDYATLSA